MQSRMTCFASTRVVEGDQRERLRRLRAARDQDAVDAALDVIRSAASGDANLLVPDS